MTIRRVQLKDGLVVAMNRVTNNICYTNGTFAELEICFWNGLYCHAFVMIPVDSAKSLLLHPKRG